MLKKFESFEEGSFESYWKSEFLNVYDYFCELDDKYSNDKLINIDYQCGYITSQQRHSLLYFIDKNGDIQGGNQDTDKHFFGSIFIQVKIAYSQAFYSPFKDNSNVSFFNNSDFLFYVMGELTKIRLRVEKKYSVGVSFDPTSIYFQIVHKKNIK